MNQGLALSLHERYPAMHKDFHLWCHQQHSKPGEAWAWGGAEGVRIINLLTQEGAMVAAISRVKLASPVILLAAGVWVLPPIYNKVSKSNSDEIFLLTTLVIVLLAAWLTHVFHLYMTLGAFVIGKMLGEGPCKY